MNFAYMILKKYINYELVNYFELLKTECVEIVGFLYNF